MKFNDLNNGKWDVLKYSFSILLMLLLALVLKINEKKI